MDRKSLYTLTFKVTRKTAVAVSSNGRPRYSSVNDVKLALEGLTTMAAALEKSTKALGAIRSLLKLIT